MLSIRLLSLVLDALRIYIWMRCLKNCIGAYRISRRIISIVFIIWWILEDAMFSSGCDTIGMQILTFCTIEPMFLLIVSFFYRGKVMRRFFMAVALPIMYWMGKLVVINTVFQTTNINNTQDFISSAITTALLFLVEIALEQNRKDKQKLEHELLKQEIVIYEKQFELIRQSQKNIRSLKHDLKHHIKMLSDMVSKGDIEAALVYLSSMGDFMENQEEYVCSGNERLDSILNFMISKAKKIGIEVDWKVQIPENLEISTFDINVILSNLLDNALNELQNIDVPVLHIVVKFNRGVLYINIQNSCRGVEKLRGDVHLLKQSGDHGYGLNNVYRIVEKYHGSFTTSMDRGIFEVSVLLFLKD